MIATTHQLVKHELPDAPVSGASELAQNPRRYFDEDSAAELLRVRTSLIRTWIENGEILAFNVARSATSGRPRWRITGEELDRFVASRLNSPASKVA